MTIPLRVLPDAVTAAQECGRQIMILLEDAMAAGATATLAISGGSSPKPMFALFAQSEFAWEQVHLFWVDERGVPPDHANSNFKMAWETWLGPIGYPPDHIHRIRGELFPDDAANRYVDEIREFFRLGPYDLPRFEVIHRGMGPDAHTASLFPGEARIEDRYNIAAPVWAPTMRQWRITMLPAVLEGARHTVILAPGADKVAALEAVLRGPYDPLHYPAQIASRDGSGAMWFVDKAAAGRG